MPTPLRDDPIAAGARAVVARLRGAGYQALWAGGAVRDRLLGLAPKDYDIATDAEPDEVAELFDRSVPVGAQFGITRVIHDGREYEIARFRAEGPREDALHRDFTINGLLYDPMEDDLIDHVGGRADITARRLRACGDDPEGRFSEDWLRVLRGVRFAAQLDLEIEAGTWAAMRRHAARVLETSAERRRDELARILTGPAPARAFAMLTELGLTCALLPEVVDLDRATSRLAHLRGAEEGAAWAALGFDWEAPTETAQTLGRRLRLPTRLARQLGAAAELARSATSYTGFGVAERKRWTRDDAAPWAREALRTAVAAGQVEAAQLDAAMADADRWTPEDLRPAALVDGRDLARAGHRPGPAFRVLLEAIEDAQLEGRVTDREAALALIPPPTE